MSPEPAATYRLQLRPGFGFEEAASLVPYLRDLGISHLYPSPYLQAVKGSTHGYDVVDPTRVNEELGGPISHAWLCETLQKEGLGQLVDIVPNHMAIAERENPWWRDVLENGRSSLYADYFDVDWDISGERRTDKILLPVLGDQYGRVLQAGEIRLIRSGGVFTLSVYDRSFPLDPSSLGDLLSRAAEDCPSELLAFLAECHRVLPSAGETNKIKKKRRSRDKRVLAMLLGRLFGENLPAAAAADREVARLNSHRDDLHALLEEQTYRLAFWRTANRELGYRRFFDIKELAGLRIEDEEVFDAVHSLPLAWARKGWVQGFRVDHPDGLRDPGGYFRRLQRASPADWIVAEKILVPGEDLPPEWPVSGTTGYEFLNLLNGLFVEGGNRGKMTALYEEFTGQKASFPQTAAECKRLVLTELLASEVSRLVSLFAEVCEGHPTHRDYTRRELETALTETAVFLPVYRTYLTEDGGEGEGRDKKYIEEALSAAGAERPDIDPELVSFLKGLLLLQIPGSLEMELAIRFQQLTGPAMAKGVEDTALYRFCPLPSLNEVGGDPQRFGVTLEEFHAGCVRLAEKHPLGLLATTTHDTKRSEDVRARISVLSEVPDLWREALGRWSERTAPFRKDGVPDRNTEYLFYATLAGAWPIEKERLSAYMLKAVREAKGHTSWRRPEEAWEALLKEFIEGALECTPFREDLENFVSSIRTPGRINSLAQTVIKMTAPGIPDIYQGTELFDLSLVDPDNRRPVDFGRRRRLLAELPGLSPEKIAADEEDGIAKLLVIQKSLDLRRRRPDLFGPRAAYRPLYARGAEKDRVVAFLRGEGAATVAPRLSARVGGWKDTLLELPGGRWTDLLTGEERGGGSVSLSSLLNRFPVALLEKREGDDGKNIALGPESP